MLDLGLENQLIDSCLSSIACSLCFSIFVFYTHYSCNEIKRIRLKVGVLGSIGRGSCIYVCKGKTKTVYA